MQTILKDSVLVLVPETPLEVETLAAWKARHGESVLLVGQNSGAGLTLSDLGHKNDALRQPIQVSSRTPDLAARLIGNFAPTPFELDGQIYATVESFWQGLKFPLEADRRRIAELDGGKAKHAGGELEYGQTISYEGVEIVVGTWRHWGLMERACWAKFSQNADAREALLSTGERPLEHRMRRDSRTIPGVIMCEIWMRIRHSLQQGWERHAPAFGD